MARTLSHRRRCRRVLRWCPPRPDLSHRNESRRTRAPALAPHWVDRLDRGLWAGRIGGLTVHDRRTCFEGGDKKSAAPVRVYKVVGIASESC